MTAPEASPLPAGIAQAIGRYDRDRTLEAADAVVDLLRPLLFPGALPRCSYCGAEHIDDAAP